MFSFNEYVSWLHLASESVVSFEIAKLDIILTFAHFDSSGNCLHLHSCIHLLLLQTCPESLSVETECDYEWERVEPNCHMDDAEQLVDREEDSVVQVPVGEL